MRWDLAVNATALHGSPIPGLDDYMHDLCVATQRLDACTDQVRTLVRLHLAGIPSFTLRARLMSDDHGAFSHEEINAALNGLLRAGWARSDAHGRLHQVIADAPVPEKYGRTADAYRRAMHPTRWDRMCNFAEQCFGRRLWKLQLLAALLCLTVGGCMRLAAQDVPDRIVAAIAAVETGTTWRGVGDVRGTWARGGIGEVGPWQMAPSVLRDLKAYDRRSRIHADPILAESLVRLWLSHLYGSTGDWSQAIAAYHAGLGGRHRGYARDYADRVLALAFPTF